MSNWHSHLIFVSYRKMNNCKLFPLLLLLRFLEQNWIRFILFLVSFAIRRRGVEKSRNDYITLNASRNVMPVLYTHTFKHTRYTDSALSYTHAKPTAKQRRIDFIFFVFSVVFDRFACRAVYPIDWRHTECSKMCRRQLQYYVLLLSKSKNSNKIYF